jgi:hypothetical protein
MKKIKIIYDCPKIYFFYVAIFLLITYIRTFSNFKPFNLLSNYVVLITDEGILKYNPSSNTHQNVVPSNAISSQNDQNYISFAQFNLDDGGYVICRLNQYIYILDKDLNSHMYFEISEIKDSYCVINPYKTIQGDITIIISYINGDQKMRLLMYKLNINDSNNLYELIHEATFQTINEYRMDQNILNKAISCELMINNNTNTILTCFVVDQQTNIISGMIINPENLLRIYFSQNLIKTKITSIIKSSVNPNKIYCLICLIDNDSYLNCLLYNSLTNNLSNMIKIFDKCQLYSYNMGVLYTKEKQEYSAFCSTNDQKMNLVKFDVNFNIKNTDNENDKCYINFSIQDDVCQTIYSFYFLYADAGKNYYIYRVCSYNNKYILNLLTVTDACNNKINATGFNINNFIISTLPLSSIVSTVMRESTVPTSLTTEINIENISTSFTTIPTSVLITTSFSTAIISTTSISFPSTIQEPLSSVIELSSTFISYSTILEPLTSILKIPSTFTSISTIQEPLSSMLYLPSTSISTSTIQESLSSTNPILSTLNESPSTLLFIPSTISSSAIYSSCPILSDSSLMPTNTSTLSFTTVIKESFTTYLASNHSLYNNESFINFYLNGDIWKGEINETKEDLEQYLDEIMKEIDIGKKYEINGNDYNITITPLNDIDSFKSTFVDFSACEEILRNEYKLSQDEILTILQIEINKMNDKALTNQVEYALYNEIRQKLDLSYCNNVDIKITYDIKNDSLLNKTMISYFSDLGIDIFNNKDSFFNDLCHPFSISNSDIILKDRLSDLYQNYSLCDDGCEYDIINIQNMSVTCTCQIKTEIKTEVSQLNFGTIVQSTFKDSNIGVIRCYNLVFNIKNKLHNYGFLVFLFFIIIHIICFVCYFIVGIKLITSFVFKEMQKNHYNARINNPIKKKKIKILKMKNKIEDISNSVINEHNSRVIINEGKEIKKKKSANKKNKKNKKKSKKHSPIIIFNCKYNNNYYKCNNNKTVNDKSKKNLTKIKFGITKLNKEGKFPGYYNLIQINANNSLKNKPPKSLYILDNYSYEEAIKYETRDFWRIYFIFLLSKENILNTFFFKSPLESQQIRISIFILNYSCDFALNALFYFNEKISDKYHYEGDSLYLFTFVNNVTIYIFSIVVSYSLVKSLNLLTNSKEAIKALFREEEQKMRKNKNYKVDPNKKKIIVKSLLKIFRVMKIKILIYIIIEFLMVSFFLYFITAFCEVYKNTQILLLYDSFISFLISIPFELLISFIESLIYVISIKVNIKFLYSLVLFLYNLG